MQRKTTNAMERILQELKAYLASASSEQLEHDWQELKEYSSIGPEISAFFAQQKLLSNVYMPQQITETSITEQTEAQSFTLDFSFHHYAIAI